MNKIIISTIAILVTYSCNHKVKMCDCICKNANDEIVIDTVFQTTQDEAYQQCMGLESTIEGGTCQSYEGK